MGGAPAADFHPLFLISADEAPPVVVNNARGTKKLRNIPFLKGSEPRAGRNGVLLRLSLQCHAEGPARAQDGRPQASEYCSAHKALWGV